MKEVRGLGLMIGVELTSHEIAGQVANLCDQKGLLVLECGTAAIRLSPPLVITREQTDMAASIFEGACREVART